MPKFRIVTFGLFKKFTEEDLLEDKKAFTNTKKRLLCYLLYENVNVEDLTEEEISQMDNLIKRQLHSKNLNPKEKVRNYEGMRMFASICGISYNLLNEKEKEILLNMDLTYENCKKMFLNILDEYTNKMKEIWPKDLEIYYEEKGFISYCHCYIEAIIKEDIKNNENNFLRLIRDYFLLDYGEIFVGDYRDNDLFDKRRKEMKKKYPELKDEYGIKNRYFEKLLGFIGDQNSDYCYSEVRNILDDYYNKKKKQNKNGYKALKQKDD